MPRHSVKAQVECMLESYALAEENIIKEILEDLEKQQDDFDIDIDTDLDMDDRAIDSDSDLDMSDLAIDFDSDLKADEHVE